MPYWYGAGMKNTGQSVKRVRERLGITQQQVADAMGIDKMTVYKLESGRMKMTADYIQGFAKALQCSATDLMDTKKTVPLVGYVGAGAEVYAIDDHAKGAGLEEVEGHAGLPENTVALRVRGDSMYPAYKDGDLIYYARDCDFDPALLGKECIVKLRDGRLFVKELKRGMRDGLFRLTSYNAPEIEGVEIEWACRIEWVKKAY
jgi:transcriptional regulator with XRE-family HTH domain